MKRILSLAVALLLVAGTAFGWPLARVWKGGPPWWSGGLTFYAPFDDPDDPLKVLRGNNSLTYTRTGTATYEDATTGNVTTAAENVLPWEEDGPLIECTVANGLLWSRGFDNAAWVKTNVTVVQNQTGRDGVDNSAYLMTATSDNGTICQSITATSNPRSGSIDIKRVGGSGPIDLSLDNGATWARNVAGLLIDNTTWYRAGKRAQTLANPTFCVRLWTSGDSVAIDYAQLEISNFVSSRIPTTTASATRNIGILSVPLGTMVSGTTGTAIMSVSSIQDRGLIDFNDARYPIYHASNTLGAYDGSTSATGPSWGDNTFVHKVAGSWSSATGKFRWVMDGGTAATANFDGDMDIGSTIYFGRRGSGTASAIGGHLKGVYLYNRVLSDAEKQILTGKCHTDYVSVAPDGVSCPSYPSNSITCWGDSLTAAEDVGYPQWLNWEFGNSRMVVNQGVSSETSTDVLARINATTNHRSSVAVFWMGNNNYSDPDTVLADIASAVFTLSTSRYVILGLVNGDYADRVAGQPGYDNIVAINTALAASYPDNYVDIRSYLIDNYDPTNATDVNDHDVKDCLPSSIRVDEIHLTEYGYSLVARRVRQFIKAKGW